MMGEREERSMDRRSVLRAGLGGAVASWALGGERGDAAYQLLRTGAAGEGQMVRATTLRRGGAELVFEEGVVGFLPEVEGRRAGAVFVGGASFGWGHPGG